MFWTIFGVSIILKSGEIEDKKEATELSQEADIVETRLGLNSNLVAIYLDDIQTHTLPSALDEVNTTEQAPNKIY